MATIELSLTIDSPPEMAWKHLSDLENHATWMKDAEAITFLTTQRRGVGTEMQVPTRVGPLRTNDVMTVTAWEEGHSITVDHHGAVSGTGTFHIGRVGSDTRLHWTETLRFPWYFGGPLGAAIAGPILRTIWRGNLARFKAIVERG